MRLPVNHIEELGLWTAEIGKGEMIQESDRIRFSSAYSACEWCA